jgi:hypothetical protein
MPQTRRAGQKFKDTRDAQKSTMVNVPSEARGAAITRLLPLMDSDTPLLAIHGLARDLTAIDPRLWSGVERLMVRHPGAERGRGPLRAAQLAPVNDPSKSTPQIIAVDNELLAPPLSGPLQCLGGSQTGGAGGKFVTLTVVSLFVTLFVT